MGATGDSPDSTVSLKTLALIAAIALIGLSGCLATHSPADNYEELDAVYYEGNETVVGVHHTTSENATSSVNIAVKNTADEPVNITIENNGILHDVNTTVDANSSILVGMQYGDAITIEPNGRDTHVPIEKIIPS